MNRRTVLALTGGSLAVALSGCLGNDSDGNGSDAPETPRDDETPADTPTDQAGEDTDTSDGTDEQDDGTDSSDDETPAATPTDDESTGTDDDESESQSPSDISGEPKKTLDEYVAAINDGDKERALALVHEDGNHDEEDVTSDVNYFEGKDISALDRTIIKAEDGEVVVRGILQIGAEDSEDGNKIGLQVRLRQGENDEWLIHEGNGYQLEGESEDESG